MAEINIDQTAITDEKANINSLIDYYNEISAGITYLYNNRPEGVAIDSVHACANTTVNLEEKIIETRDRLILLENSLNGKIFLNFNTDDFTEIESINVNNIDYSNISEDGYIVQGYTNVGDYTFITAHAEGDSDKPRIYVYNNKTGEYEGKIILTSNCHVGGITYDPDNGLMYISGSGSKIKAYDYNQMITAFETVKNNTRTEATLDLNTLADNSSIIVGTINLPEGSKPATVYYNNGTLYANTFVGRGHGTTYEFNVNCDPTTGTVTSTQTNSYNSPRMVQGMSITNYNGQEYYVYAQSYSRKNKSSVCVYTRNPDGSFHYEGKVYYDQPGLEGINIDSEGNVQAVFEFGDQQVMNTTMEDIVNNLTYEEDSACESKRDSDGSAYDFKQWLKKVF